MGGSRRNGFIHGCLLQLQPTRPHLSRLPQPVIGESACSRATRDDKKTRFVNKVPPFPSAFGESWCVTVGGSRRNGFIHDERMGRSKESDEAPPGGVTANDSSRQRGSDEAMVSTT